MSMMRPPDPFGYVLKRTQSALRSAMDGALAALDLTTPQYSALSQVAQEQGLSNAELARRCFVTPQTMHQILGGLEREGLVTRSQHPEHGRIQQTSLTAKGEQRLTQAHERVSSVEARMTQSLSPTEIAQATGVLVKCYESLEQKG